MGFKIDGSSHQTGIRNEDKFIKRINDGKGPIYKKALTLFCVAASALVGDADTSAAIVCNKLGGTRNHDDAEIKCGDKRIGVSIKNHKTGTWDWAKTSLNEERYAAYPFMMESLRETKERSLQHFENSWDQFRELNAQQKNPILEDKFEVMKNKLFEGLKTAIYSGWVDDIFDAAFNNFTSDDIRASLLLDVNNYSDYIVVNNVETNAWIWFETRENLHVFRDKDELEFELRSTERAKTSRQIWARRRGSDDEWVNTNLRLRVILNNGVTAMIRPLPGKNQSSTPCIQIQQDNVNSFMENLVNPVMDYYGQTKPTKSAVAVQSASGEATVPNVDEQLYPDEAADIVVASHATAEATVPDVDA